MIITLIFVTIAILWYVCWFLFDKRLTCPVMLMMTGYLCCSGAACLSNFVIEFDYHWITYVIVFVSVGLFIVTSYICRSVFNRKSVCLVRQLDIIYISPWVLIVHAVCVVFCFVISVYLFVDILDSVGIGADFLNAIPKMRALIVENPDIFNDNKFLFVNQIKKIFAITGYLFSAIWCRNCILRKHLELNSLLFANVFLCFALTFTEGGRGSIVAFVLSVLVLFCMYNETYRNWRLRFDTRTVLMLPIVFVGCCIVFFSLLWVTGREHGDFSFYSFIFHVSEYLGCSLPLLDNFLTTTDILSFHDGIVGNETMHSIITQLIKFNIIDGDIYNINLEFRPGVYPGNIYTAMRSYIHDYGLFGIIVLPILYATIASALYYLSSRYLNMVAVPVLLILYAKLSYPIFTDFVRCYFFQSFFDINIIVICFGTFLIKNFFVKTGLIRTINK